MSLNSNYVSTPKKWKGSYIEMLAFSGMQEYDEWVINSGTNVGNKYEYRGATAGWVNTDIGGATSVSIPYPDVTIFDTTTITPVAGISIPFVTVPAGCYAMNIRAVKTTVGAILTAFSGLAYIERNAAASATGNDYYLQAGDDITFKVGPGDTINIMGSTGCAGSLLLTPLG